DYKVTGVQTCALPISSATQLSPAGYSPIHWHTISAHPYMFRSGGSVSAYPMARLSQPDRRQLLRCLPELLSPFVQNLMRGTSHRSEERRVGKECRSAW